MIKMAAVLRQFFAEQRYNSLQALFAPWLIVCLLPARVWLTTTDVAMLQLLWITWVAHRCGTRWAIACTVLSVMLLDWFFVLPYYTLNVHHADYLATFAVMLLLGVVISQLSGRLRRQLQRTHNIMSQMRGMFMLAKGLVQRNTFTEQRDFSLKLLQHRLQAEVCWSDSLPTANSSTEKVLPLTLLDTTFAWLTMPLVAYERNHTLVNTAVSMLLQIYQRQALEQQSRQAHIRAELERDRAMMLRSISHDLRTPLATIMGASSMLADEQLPLSAEDMRQQAQNIYQQSSILNEHFNKVMELSRVQQPEKLLQAVDIAVADVISAAIARRSELLQSLDITLDTVTTTRCVCDATLMEIALANMLENAAKHGRSPLTIRCSVIQQQYCLTVENGWQPKKHGQRDSGTGLGLPICHAVAQLHQGQFTLTSGNSHHATVAQLCWPIADSTDE